MAAGSTARIRPTQVKGNKSYACANVICIPNPVGGLDQRGYLRANADGNQDGGTDGDKCDIGAFERFVEPVLDQLFYLPLVIK